MRTARELAPWIEGACLAGVVLAILAAGGDSLRASYHGYLHAALGESVLREGLTPENPYHAGAPLRYYTLYPLLGAALGRLGIGPLWAFVALDVLAALLLPPALDALGRGFGLSFRARRAAFLAAVLGFNGLGWIGFLVDRGPGTSVLPVFALAPTTFMHKAFGWDARLQAFLPKFLNVSSYAIALPFALWALAVSVPRADRPRRPAAEGAILAATLAASLALNPLVGGFAGLCAALWLAPGLRSGGWGRRIAWGLAFLAAGALALPFLLPALQPAAQGASMTGEVALGGRPISNLLGPILLLLPLGALGLPLLPAPVRRRFLAAAAIAAVLVLLGEMPLGNEYKMSRLSGLLWALPAGAFSARLPRPWPVVLALSCVPTTLAVPWAYLGWSAHASLLPLENRGGALAPRDRAVRALFDAESRADPRAVVLMSPAFPGARAGPGLVQGNALAPALRHPLFVDLPQIHNDRLPDLGERIELLEVLYGFEEYEPVASALSRIRGALPDRPFLVFTEDSVPEPGATLAGSDAAVLARGDGCALWSLPALRE